MKKTPSKRTLQNWYDRACWYGHVDTKQFGRLFPSDLHRMAAEQNFELKYPHVS